MSQFYVTGTGGGPPPPINLTLTGDFGGPIAPIANNWNTIAGISSFNCGGSVFIGGTPGTLMLNLSTSGNSANTLLGKNCGQASLAVTAQKCTGLGFSCLFNLTSGTDNTAMGTLCASSTTTGSRCTTMGSGAVLNPTTSDSIGIGYNAGLNIYLGTSALIPYSNNIMIGSLGVFQDTNTIRIGANGSGAAQQNRCFIAGIIGVTVSNALTVMIDSTTGQLGVGSVTPLPDVFEYTAVSHAMSPYTVLLSDEYLGVTTTAGVVTIKLPNNPPTGQAWIIKDTAGNSATNAITVTTVGGAVTIDGATSYTIGTNYEAINVIFNGTSYEVY